MNYEKRLEVVELKLQGLSDREVSEITGVPKTTVNDLMNRRGKVNQEFWVDFEEKVAAGVYNKIHGPRILTLDIETAPIKACIWRLFKENIGINQIETDWYIISWAAKWLHEDEVMYEDKSDSWNNEDDFDLLQNIWKLLDEADIIITQNGKRFDEKKLNARFILNGMKPPSSYRHVDTLEIAKRHFGFSSNKLEYMTKKLCKKYKKDTHEKYSGFLLWKECLEGNMEAWQEMQQYNILDVLSLEELYTILRPWYKAHPNINLYYNDEVTRCKCGGESFTQNGYHYTNTSKFLRLQCNDCGAEVRDKVNLLPKSKRDSLKMNVI